MGCTTSVDGHGAALACGMNVCWDSLTAALRPLPSCIPPDQVKLLVVELPLRAEICDL